MASRGTIGRLALPAVALATVGCLQPGIDPVFLVLASAAHGVTPDFHGWIVSATQTGFALGSVATWLYGPKLSERTFTLAALCAAFAAFATAHVGHPAALVAIRGGYGLAMGLLYTQAMAHAATNRPNGSYAAVFMLQLVLSTLVALLLPGIADFASAKLALATLTLAPLAAFAIAVRFPDALGPVAGRSGHPVSDTAVPPETHGRIGPEVWLLGASTFLFICATMMVWSFTGAMAIGARFDEKLIGMAVAAGSIAGAATAFALMGERVRVSPVATGALCGLTLLAPIFAASFGNAFHFVAAIVLFNIGSTAIIVRNSGLASSASHNSLSRRFVTCTHSLGMIAGPAIGSLSTYAAEQSGLLTAAIVSIAMGCLMLIVWAVRQGHWTGDLPVQETSFTVA